MPIYLKKEDYFNHFSALQNIEVNLSLFS